MSRMPGATWRPVKNYTAGGQLSVRGVVIHIMDGTLAGTESWFNDSDAQASSHFGTGKGGELRQWVDTADRAWAQSAGNTSWLSIENEGKGGDTLTSAQLDRCADVLRWAHQTYGVPLQLASSPSGEGLGYHAMGGAAWGGHTSCPGSKIVAQLGEIVKRAGGSGSGSAAGSGSSSSSVARYQVTIGGLAYGYGAHGSQVTAVGKALVAKGFGKHYAQGPGPDWSDADTENYADFQRSLGYTGADADGVPGEASLKKLLGKLPAPAAKPSVDLSELVRAARTDPGAAQGHQTYAAGVRLVEAALVAEGLLRSEYARDGSFGSLTKAAYSSWQRSKAGGGYSGADADGIPGEASLKKLGQAHGFTVVA